MANMRDSLSVTAARESDNAVRVSWDGWSGAAGTATVYRLTDAPPREATPQVVATAPAGDGTWLDTSVGPDHSYSYIVEIGGSSGSSGTVYTTPAAPSSCHAAYVSDSLVRVSWPLTGNAYRMWHAVCLERRTDSGEWVQIATLGGPRTNHDDNGVSAGHRYAYRVRSRTMDGLYSGYAASGSVYTSPAGGFEVTARAVAAGRAQVTVEDGSPWADAYEVERSADGANWSERASSRMLPVEMRLSGPRNRYRLRAGRGSRWSGWVESREITDVAKPGRPTVLGLAPIVEVGSSASVGWEPNHSDGSQQSMAEVEVSDPLGSSTVTRVDGGALSTDVEFGKPGRWGVRVRTHGVHSEWGDWSDRIEVTAASAPVVEITSPATDSSVVDSLPLEVRWDVVDTSGVSSQSLRLLGADGGVLHSVELGGGERSYQLGDATYLPGNARTFRVEVTVRAGSTLTGSAVRVFATDYAAPAIPEASWSVTDGLGIDITVYRGGSAWLVDELTLVGPERLIDDDGIPVTSGLEAAAGGTVEFGGVMATESVSVTRVAPDGGRWLVAAGVEDGSAVRDPLPPLGTPFRYLVTAYGDIGTATTLELPVTIDADAVAINFGRAASGFIPLKYDVEWSRDYELSTELMDFADGGEAGGLPTAYTTGSASIKGSLSATALGREDHDALDALARRHAVAWVRDPHGRRALCAIGLGLSGGVPRDVAGVNLSLTETAWREAWDG